MFTRKILIAMLVVSAGCMGSATGASTRVEDIVRIEGAWPKFDNWTATYKLACGDGLAVREPMGVADAAGYRAGYEFTVPRAGRYQLWMLGLPLNVAYASPVNITVNGVTMNLGEAKSFGRHPASKHGLSVWSRMCQVDLLAGQNDIVIQVIERRKKPDTEFCFYLDEFILAPVGWQLPDDKNPQLPEPANIKPEAAHRSFMINAAATGIPFSEITYDLVQGAGPQVWPEGFADAVIPQLKELRPNYFRKDNFVPKTTKVDGEWQYDFSDLDRIVDDIVAMGAQVIPCPEAGLPAREGVPARQQTNLQAWTDGPESAAKNSSTPKPLNLAGWEEYWYQIVKHFNVDRKLGIRYWEVLNEPDQQAWYHDHYIEVFKAAQHGALRADPTVLVGGPACIGYTGAIPFIRNCVAAGVNPGFVSYHTYGVAGDEFVDHAEAIRAEARQLTGNPELPVVITEWGVSSTPQYYWLNTLAAAFNGSVYTAMARRPGCPDVATQFLIKDPFPGAEFGLFDADNRPRPSFHAAHLFRTMSGNIVSLSGDRSESLDGLATRDGGSVKVFLWNMEREGTPRRQINLRIQNIPKQGYQWRRAVVDPYCSNPYNRRHANPEEASLVWTAWQSAEAGEVGLELDFEMVPPGVTLVEIVAE